MLYGYRATKQINGREGETATFLSRYSLNLAFVLAVSPHVISTVRCFLPVRGGSYKFGVKVLKNEKI
jgi:hypothetical protein